MGFATKTTEFRPGRKRLSEEKPPNVGRTVILELKNPETSIFFQVALSCVKESGARALRTTAHTLF